MLMPLLLIYYFGTAHALPIVDPGLFVIMGVSSCREGSGYCLLGLDCTLDQDFLPDDKGGHCNGLRSAFTPSAHFICCRYNSDNASSHSPILNTTSNILDNHLIGDSMPTQTTFLSFASENTAQEIVTSTTDDTNLYTVDLTATEVEYSTAKSYEIITTIAEGISEQEEGPINNMQQESHSNSTLNSVPKNFAHLSSVSEVNLELTVHDNIHEINVNKEKMQDNWETSTALCNQDEGCKQETSISTFRTLHLVGETTIPNFMTRQENIEELDPTTFLSSLASQELTTTEMASTTTDMGQTQDSERETTNEIEITDFERVTDSTPIENNTEMSPYGNSANAESLSILEDVVKNYTNPSLINIRNSNVETKSTVQEAFELNVATIKPVRSNEISAEQEDYEVVNNELHTTTFTTATGCNAAVGRNCWLVKFMNGTDTICMGSFLKNNIILTAASCIARIFDIGISTVTLKTSEGADLPQDLIHDVIVHEEYKTKSVQVALNDIGMVRLEPALYTSSSTCILCLPNSESDLMDKACNGISKEYSNRKSLELAGSPMVCQGSVVGGVVSFYNPDPVYTPISDFLSWIRQNMDIRNIPLQWEN